MKGARARKISIFSLILILSALFMSCENETDFAEDVENDYNSKFTFYSSNPDEGKVVSVDMTFPIGKTVSQKDFPNEKSSGFVGCKNGYKIKGWTYLKNPETGKKDFTESEEKYEVNPDGTVKKMVVLSVPAAFIVNEWEPIKYSVTFYGNGGTDSAGKKELTQENFVYDEANVLNKNPFSYQKNSFSGWGTSPDQDPKFPTYFNGADVCNLTSEDGGNIKLYALWLRNVINFSFDAGEGTGMLPKMKISLGSALPDYEHLVAAFTPPEGKKISGYQPYFTDGSGRKIYIGFYEPGHVFTAEDYPYEDQTLEIQYYWIPYFVQFHSNIQDESESVFSQSFEWGQAQALLENPFSRWGFEFTGWNTKPDGSGTSYTDGQILSEKLAENTTIELYAQWKELVRKVTFMANGGTGTMEEQEFRGRDLPKSLSENQFLREGYSFTGWNTQPDGSGTSYMPEEEINGGNWFSEDKILYAMWNIIYYPVDFDTADGTPIETQWIPHNETATEPESPSRLGYTFGGWFKDSEYTEPFDFSTPIKQGTIVWAYWNVESRVVNFDLNEGDDEPFASVTITFEDLPYYPYSTPSRTGYFFTHWSPDTLTPDNWSTEEITMIANWKARGSIVGNLPYGVDVEFTPEGMIFVALDGFETYDWMIDGAKQTETGNRLTVKYADYTDLKIHQVLVIGNPFYEEDDSLAAIFKFRVQN